MMYVCCHLPHPWGQLCHWIPLIVTPLGFLTPQQMQRRLLITAHASVYTAKTNLPSMAAGLLTASLWTRWVMNSSLNSSFEKCYVLFLHLQCNLTRLPIHECLNVFSTVTLLKVTLLFPPLKSVCATFQSVNKAYLLMLYIVYILAVFYYISVSHFICFIVLCKIYAVKQLNCLNADRYFDT